MWSPKSLYATVLRHIVRDKRLALASWRQCQLTPGMRFDLCWEVYASHNVEFLEQALTDVRPFGDLLKLGYRREELHMIFEAASRSVSLARLLANDFNCKVTGMPSAYLLNLGHHLASFLIDGAWYVAAESVLVALRNLNRSITVDEQAGLTKDLELMTSLLHALSEYRNYPHADQLYAIITANSLVNDAAYSGINLAAVFCELSGYCFGKSLYKEAFELSMKAVRILDAGLPSRVKIDVLRQAGKASVVRRQFAQAETLLQEALILARDAYGECHLKYADCLVDFGFYLLNVDGVARSVQAYEKALAIREAVLGRSNLLVAKTHEDLAYAMYVCEYNTGRFETAKRHAETALHLLQRIVPPNHLLLASAQRVLALIVEEIALDLNDKPTSPDMLQEAEKLHLSAIALTKASFGEVNVQTAKHYGNLGRLYQTMGKFERAEEMHLKAIEIKEALLGRDDYEVALSIGHLASLYNYDLREFEKARDLYMRSIAISLRLFGPSYSGLEYDYRGLVRVYEETLDWDNAYLYIYKLGVWKTLWRTRQKHNTQETSFVAANQAPKPINKILQLLHADASPLSP